MGLFSRPFAVRYRGLSDAASDIRFEPPLSVDLPRAADAEPATETHADIPPAPQSQRMIPRLMRAMRRLPLKWRIAVLVPAVLVIAAIADFSAMMAYYTLTFPHPMAIRGAESAPIVRILARDGSVLAERGAAHDYMPIDLIPIDVREAVVATEDRRFFDHHGVDVVGLTRALFANLRAGRFAQGGSTLTQQLAKNLFLSPERTLGRKIEELGLAFWLELRVS